MRQKSRSLNGEQVASPNLIRAVEMQLIKVVTVSDEETAKRFRVVGASSSTPVICEHWRNINQ